MIAKKNNNILIIFIIAAFFALNLFFKLNINSYSIPISPQQTSYNLKANIFKNFSLGQENFIVSIVWILTFINADINRDQAIIFNDWLYLRFNFITELTPRFYEAYLFGGQYLSIIKDNPNAAEKLLKKGVLEFPNDFWLNYYRGFNALFELKNKQIALSSFQIVNKDKLIKKYPVLINLYYKLLFESKKIKELGAEVTKSTNQKLKNFYYNLKAKIDLKCLNNSNKQKKCDKVDLFGENYIKRRGQYFPQNSFKSFINLEN